MPKVKPVVTDAAYIVERPKSGPKRFDHLGYAQMVLANPHKFCAEFRNVARNHLKEYYDSITGKRDDIYFDEEAPFTFLQFCWFFWIVVNTDDEIVLFDPLDWQKFVSYLVLGWKVTDKDTLARLPGTRRYRKLYLITAKGSGKTPWVSCLGMFMGTADRLPNGNRVNDPSVYICASTIEQTNITMNYIEQAIQHSEVLAKTFQVSQSMTSSRTVKPYAGARRHPIISTFAYAGSRGLSGQTPSFNIIEELHEHLDNRGMIMLEKGIKRRQQPLTVITTNAGETTAGFAYDEHKYACEIAKGDKAEDQYLAVIFQLDKNDDREDKSLWIKANPSLGTTIRMDYLIGEYEKAQRSPEQLRDFYRLNLGIWPDQNTVPFVDRGAIELCEKLSYPSEDELKAWKLFLGLDLAPMRDLSALAFCFANEDFSKFHLRVKAYCAGDNLAEKESKCNAPLRTWADEGYLTLTDGRGLDYGVIVEDIGLALEQYNIYGLAYDDYDINIFCRHLKQAGIVYGGKPTDDLVMVSHPQGHRREDLNKKGLTMGGSINCLESRILNDPPTISIESNPLFRYAVALTEVHLGQYGSRTFIKARGGKHVFGYIDPLVAGTMAVGYADTLGIDIPVISRKQRQRFITKEGVANMAEALKGLGV